ncbi:MAG: right-handed parallel beta-helix repeat-containing protein [Cyanobacteria bacterium P01_D01_bin.105]
MSIITVTNSADSGNGSLRSAITTANSGDTIQFSNTLAQKTIKLTSGQLVLNKNLTIDGGKAPGLTISGNNASRVFYLDRKKTATLKNLTIANGKTTGAGGGIDTRHESTITLDNVRVHNNKSELGGGMRVGHLAKATILNSSFKGNDGTLTDKHKGFSAGAISHNESRGQIIVKDTVFEGNKGFLGGAIYSFSSVTFTVEGSSFLDNSAERSGGAIFTDGVSSRDYNSGFADDGKLIIRDSQFKGNETKGEGGALYLWGYTKTQRYKDDRVIIENSEFVDNVATPDAAGGSKGGAIWAKMGIDIRNTTFANNTATQQGGALWTESSLPISIANSTFSGNRVIQDAGGAMFLNNRSRPVNITNSTIVHNTAGRANGALWYDGSHNVTLKNSIVAFNRAERDLLQDQVGYRANDGGGNLEFALSTQAMRVVDGSVVADPQIEALKLVDGMLVHPLSADSPAVNAGVRSGAPATDQRGVQRDSQTDLALLNLRLLRAVLRLWRHHPPLLFLGSSRWLI